MSRAVVDVSVFQGNMNAAVTKAAGIDGVVARAAHGLAKDTKFRDFALRCAQVGLPFGAYHFLEPTQGDAATHAAVMRSACDGVRLTLTTQVDVERPVTVQWVTEYIAQLEASGFPRCSIYLNDSLGVNLSPLANRDLWAPDYVKGTPPGPDEWEAWALARKPSGPGIPTGWDTWNVWQFSADGNGQAARYGFTGASTAIDLDIVRDETWARWQPAAAAGPSSTIWDD